MDVTRFDGPSYRLRDDPDFLRFLNGLRERQPTQEEVDAALPPDAHNISTSAAAEEVDASCVVLCTHCEDRAVWNGVVLRTTFQAAYIVACPVQRSPALPRRELAAFTAQEPHFHELAEVAVGALVIWRRTAERGQGRCQRRNRHRDETAAQPKRRHHVCARLEDARYEPTYVHRSVEKAYMNPETGQRHTLRTFPLRLAYARTAYAAQGATLRGCVYVHIRNAFARGMAYVMLSRVPRRLAPDGTVMIKLAGGRPACKAHPPRQPRKAVGAGGLDPPLSQPLFAGTASARNARRRGENYTHIQLERRKANAQLTSTPPSP